MPFENRHVSHKYNEVFSSCQPGQVTSRQYRGLEENAPMD